MVDESRKVTVGEILSEWSAAFVRHARVLALAIVGMTVAGAAADLTLGSAAQFTSSIAMVVIEIFLLDRMLRTEGLILDGRGRLPLAAALGASILTGLGILAGLLLLVVPGLVVMARWSLAISLVVAEGLGARDAMAESWRRTRVSMVPIAVFYVVALILVFAPLVILGLGMGVMGGEDLPASWNGRVPDALAGNALSSLVGVGGTLLSLALYRLLGSPRQQISLVFS